MHTAACTFRPVATIAALFLIPVLLHAKTPAPTGLKIERLAGEQIRVTVNQPPADVTRMDWRSRSTSGTWGVGRPVEPMSRVFILDGFRRYLPYSFEVKFRGKDGWSDGTHAEIPPAPFLLGLHIDMEDLRRRGWAVTRERKPVAPLLVVVEKDFEGEQLAVHHVLLYRKDGTALTDKDGRVLGFRVEVKLPKGVRELPIPLDKLIREALKRLGDPATEPKDPDDIVLLWIPPPDDIHWLRRDALVSGVPQTIFFAEPRLTFGIKLRY